MIWFLYSPSKDMKICFQFDKKRKEEGREREEKRGERREREPLIILWLTFQCGVYECLVLRLEQWLQPCCMYMLLYAHYREECIADTIAGTKLGIAIGVLLMSGGNSFGNPWRKCILKVSFIVGKMLDLTYLSLPATSLPTLSSLRSLQSLEGNLEIVLPFYKVSFVSNWTLWKELLPSADQGGHL